MTSFVAQVLTSADRIEKEDMAEKINKLSSKITTLKLDMKEYLESRYVHFTTHLSESLQLAVRLKDVSEEMNAIQMRIDAKTRRELNNSTGELQELSSALKEVSLTLQLVKHLAAINTCLNAAKEHQRSGHYFRASRELVACSRLLQEGTESDGSMPPDLQKLEILPALTVDWTLQKEKFLLDLGEKWKEAIKWEEEEETSETELVVKAILKKIKKKQVCLKLRRGNSDEFSELLQAMHYFSYLDFKLKRFGSRLLDLVLSPAVRLEDCSVTFEETNSLGPAVLLRIVTVEKNLKSVPKPSYDVALGRLQAVFKFLHENLNVNAVNDDNASISLMRCLGEVIADDFCELFTKECLAATIPTSSEGLGHYDSIIYKTEDFQSYLMEIGFLSSEKGSLLDYAKNVDILFANKMCQNLLDQARKIMCRDLHDTVEVCPEKPEPLVKVEDLDTTYATALTPEVKLSENTLQFPKCLISKSAKDLMELVHSILHDASSSSPLCSVRLFYTARNIFELYKSVVPTYHKDFLTTIPQQSALLHNNCLYLSHHLLTLGHQYRSRLPDVLQEHTTTFVDLVPALRKLGTDSFLSQLQRQRKQIWDILRESGLQMIGEEPCLPLTVEKAVRQCLRQLELLQTVWQPVLPDNVYNKAMGILINAYVEELIIRVTTVEDIPAETAVQLVTVFGIVVGKAPQVLCHPGDIIRSVAKWQKFRELVLILGASLRDIEDRWAGGRGPLAYEFKPDEVKQLVRALFQNTDRRAAVLAKIK